MAAFLPCRGRAELPPSAAEQAQKLPFGRFSRSPSSPGGRGAPNSYERARGQAPLNGAFKTTKISYFTGLGDARPSTALESAHTYPAGPAPLARGYFPAQELRSRPLGYRLDARGRGSASWRAAGWHWHSWAAGRCVGWLEVPKGSLNHLSALTPAAGAWSACQRWVLEGKSEGSDDGGGFEAGCGLRGGCMEEIRCYAGVRVLGGLVCYPGPG